MMFTRPIGPDDVEKIAALGDPVLRNLWITTAYHDLGQGLARLLGGGNTSWSTFATWASKTAGLSIRKDVLVQIINATPHGRLADRVVARVDLTALPGLSRFDLTGGVAQAIDDAVTAVSRQIAEGNLKVFQELGPLFARTVATFGAGPATDAARRDALLASVTSLEGDPEATRSLRAAFAALCAAMIEPDERTRAGRIFYGNALIGLVEQTHLQLNIEGALNAPLEESFANWLDHTLNRVVRLRPLRRVIEAEFQRLLPDIVELWREAVTAHLMTLVTPDGVLNLGHDVPPLAAGQPLFPPDLQALRDPDVTPYAQFDRTDGTGNGSGARDWAELRDRMGYIVNLFRSRQQSASLLTAAPFTQAQWAVMQSGGVPPGPL
jgi:hypothetical protein